MSGRRMRPGVRSSIVERTIRTAALALLVAAMAACRSSPSGASVPAQPAGPGAPAAGMPAPEFRLLSTDQTEVGLPDLRGRVVLVTFWATWCGPCKQELPAIDSVYRRLRSSGFAVVGVDYREQGADVSSFAQRSGLSFPLLQDSTGEVAFRYRLPGVPASYLVDRDGLLRQIHVGPLSAKELTRMVDALLSAPATTGTP